MSLPLPILLSLASGPGNARMRLECEVRRGRYFLFTVEGRERWPVLPPGARPEAEHQGLTRAKAFSAAVLEGFATRTIERAIRRAELRGGLRDRPKS